MEIVIGAVAGVVVLALGGWYFYRREKRRRNYNPHDVYPHW
jgi:LPXTG-motif cell wall-anchored protein